MAVGVLYPWTRSLRPPGSEKEMQALPGFEPTLERDGSSVSTLSCETDCILIPTRYRGSRCYNIERQGGLFWSASIYLVKTRRGVRGGRANSKRYLDIATQNRKSKRVPELVFSCRCYGVARVRVVASLNTCAFLCSTCLLTETI